MANDKYGGFSLPNVTLESDEGGDAFVDTGFSLDLEKIEIEEIEHVSLDELTDYRGLRAEKDIVKKLKNKYESLGFEIKESGVGRDTVVITHKETGISKTIPLPTGWNKLSNFASSVQVGTWEDTQHQISSFVEANYDKKLDITTENGKVYFEGKELTWQDAIDNKHIYRALSRKQKRIIAKNSGQQEPLSTNPVIDFFGDVQQYLGYTKTNLFQALDSGLARADAFDETSDLLYQGDALSDDELQEYINVTLHSQKFGEIESFKKWSDSYDKHKENGENAAMSTILAIKEEGVGGLLGVMIQSMSGLLNKEILARGGVGAVGGAATGTFVAPVIGTVGGGISGFFTGANAAAETMISFSGLIQEELEGKGWDFTPESIRRLINEHPETWKDIKWKARSRGATIGTVEGVSSLLGMKGASKVFTKTSAKLGTNVTGRLAATTASTLTAGTSEMVGGSLGEALGLLVEGKPLDAKEIIVEGIAGLGGAPVTASVGIGKSLINTPGYSIGGKIVTQEEMKETIEKSTPQQLAEMNLEITNDPVLNKVKNDKQIEAIIESQLDTRVSDEKDRADLVELEKRRQEIENNKTQSSKNELKSIDAQIEEITNKYEGVDRRTKAVKAREKVKVTVRKARRKILMDKIKTGVEKSKLYQDMDISMENLTAEEAVDIREQQEEDNALYDLGLLEEELSKTQDPKERAKIRAEIKAVEKDITEVRESRSEARDAHGFLLEDHSTGELRIIVNEDKALADKGGNINVVAHEFLHAVLDKTFNVESKNYAVKTAKGLGSTVGGALYQYLKTLDPNIASNSFILRMLSYAEAGEETMGQEVLNIMSDALIDGSFNPNETVLNKVGDTILTFFESIGLGKLKWKSPRDVYRFVKNFNKSVRGDKMAARVVKRAAKGVDIITEEAKPTKVEKAKTPMSKTISETIVDDKAFENKIQELYEKGDLDAIQEAYKPRIKRILKAEWGWTEENETKFNAIVDEAVGPDRGILQLILGPGKTKYDPTLGVPLSGHIGSVFQKRGLSEFVKREYPEGVIEQQMGKEAVAEKVAKIAAKPQDVILTPKVLEQYKTPLLSGFTFVKEQIKTLRNTVSRIVGGKLPALDAAVSKNKSISPLVADMKKQLYIKNGPIHNVVYDLMTTKVETLTQEYLKKTNPKTKKPYILKDAKNQAFKDSVEAFFKNPKYKKAILDSLTTTWLAKHLPMGVQKEVNGIGWTTDWKGRTKGIKKGQINFWRMAEEGPYKGMTDGKQKIRRNPNAMRDITPAMLLSAFVKGKTMTDIKRGGLENISLAVTQELGLETFKADMINDGPLKALFTGRQELFDRILNDNFVEEFVRQVERGTTKFSKPVKTMFSFPLEQEINKAAKWDIILSDISPKFTRLSMTNDTQRSLYKHFILEVIARRFPEAFITKGSTFTGAGANRAYKANFAFKNKKQELTPFIQSAKKNGVKFGINLTEQEKTDITNAVTRKEYGKKSRGKQKNVMFEKEFKASKKRGFKLIWKIIQDTIQEDSNTIPYFANMLSSSSQQMGHFMRLGADIGFVNLLDGVNVEEHLMPATPLTKYLFGRAIQGNLFDAETNYFDVAVDKYTQGALPKIFDRAKLEGVGVDGKPYNYTDMIPLEHAYDVFMGLKDVWVRYFHPNVNNNNGGIDPNVIELANGNTVAQEFGVGVDRRSFKDGIIPQDVIAVQQELIYKQAIGEKISGKKLQDVISKVSKLKHQPNNKGYKVFNDAVSTSRTAFSKPNRGASFWDFDDTVARTKSGVLYRTPNPDNSPQPGRKVIFLAGAPGAGKSTVVKALGLEEQGFKVVNQDISLQWLAKNHGLPTDMRDFTPEQASKWGELSWDARMIAKRKQTKFQGRGDGIIVDGTGSSLRSMKMQFMEFEMKGYDVHMLFVETSKEVAIERNRARKERSLKTSIVTRTWDNVMDNKRAFMRPNMFGENFTEINTDNLKQGDPMPAALVNKLDKFTKGYIKGRLDAGEFAERGTELKEQGAEFDFSEFVGVRQGEKGPLFGKAMARAKKFGTKDQFIVTARPHAAKPHIYEFLKSQGLEIPLDNIITLENSTSEAKALTIAEKIAEGYNDIYFADDALQNIQAVKNMMDQFDVKGVVQQAKTKFSKGVNSEFNKIIEETKGVPREKIFSAALAAKRGGKKGRWKFFIPPSAEDFTGLLYNFLGKGKKGEAHMAFFKKALINPLNRAYRELNAAKQTIANDFKALKKQFPDVRKKLGKKIPDGDFTYGDAIRVYLWDKAGFDIPGLKQSETKDLAEVIKKDPSLQAFADTLGLISKQKEGYVQPGEFWLTEDIRNDLDNATGKIGRKQFLSEFIENAEIIFSKENLNKIEAVYGSKFREALEDVLYRTINGTNRNFGSNRILNGFMNWINGSIGATMFFNARSAVLQTLSTVNFINWGDNNPFKAGLAFANQPQFWKDFAFIFNSDMLKQRRTGLKQDINAAELTNYVSKSKEPVRAAINWLLQKGFLPTQLADSFAIATGGSTFYRNRIKTYMKQGFSQQEAESKAWIDFQEIAEATQQSARPDMISQQQASPLGRVILAFQNTPMQYMRLMKKAAMDLVAGRGDAKTNISKIVYYGMIQNLIFYSLQSAMFAMMFGDDDDEDEKFLKRKKDRIANSMVDGILRGIGVGGAVISTVKNMIMKFIEQERKAKDDKFYTEPDHAYTLIEALNLSPPIGIKARKIYSSTQTYEFNREVIKEMETFDIDNPVWQSVGNVVEATTNVPLARLHNKTMNLREAANGDNEAWQRVAMFLGWNRWDVGVRSEEVKEIKKKIKTRKKEEKKKDKKESVDIGLENKFEEDQKNERKKGKKEITCIAVNKGGKRCNIKVVGKNKYCTIHEKVPERADGKKTQCKKVKSNGKRCKVKTASILGYCYYHD